MAHTKTNQIGHWDTFHNNGPFATKTLFDTHLEKKENMPAAIDRYKDAAEEIQRLIRDSINNHERFRAYGSAWSLSNIAHQKDRMHYNGRMNISLAIDQNNLHASTTYKSEDLFYFQCGNIIKEVSEFVHDHGKSLKASGASNGQTIAGAISTGVHGAAIDGGAIHDSVVGLNLIIGPDPDDIVYIERQSQPALNDDFINQLNSRVIRNDGLFNAALVSLGSFGFIHGVVVETEDRYLLKRYTKKISKEHALELAETMNFQDASFKIPTELDSTGKGLRPYHYKLYINPFNDKEDYVTEIIYKKPYRSDYPNPIPRIKTAIYKDLPTWIARFAAKHKRSIPKIMKAMQGVVFPKLDVETEGTIGEIFWDSTHQGAAFAISFGVDHSDTREALDLFIKVINEEGPIPGAIGVRFIKASKATLAFTKFPTTCILEIDGVLWKGNQNMISLNDFGYALIEAFQSAGINFTLHWGKNAAWSFPGLLDLMYQDKDDEWKNYRSALLSKSMADLFSNGFLDTLKLSDYRQNTPENLIASINVEAQNIS
ncbi:MAG: hypothetical protein ACJA2S_001703 [Cyclobacteriaceae bacterium]|jgi:hypothetical protein